MSASLKDGERRKMVGGWPVTKAPCVGAQAQAEMWLQWDCARKGIELPLDSKIAFHADGAHGVASLTMKQLARLRSGGRGNKHHRHMAPTDVEVMRLPIPAWAMPTTRADLFNMALQSGKCLSDCLAFGMGYYGRSGADEATIPGEEWDRMQVERLLDNGARDRTFYAEDSRLYDMAGDAANMEAEYEMAQERIDYAIAA